MSSNTILPRSFYERDTLCVAKDLLGKVLKFADYYGVINEVEAYVGQDDPACHAARGCTPRTAVMFGAAGFSYVYLIYGMYHCLNIVTEREGFPAAVLIRGIDLYKPTVLSLNGPGKLCKKLNITKNNNQIDLIRGIDLYTPTVITLDGPGKLCKKLNITKNNNQIDLTQCHDFCVYSSSIQPKYIATPRIGIKVGTDKLWRFKTR